MAIIIKEFNLLYKHLNMGRNAYAILLRQLSIDPITSTTPVPSQLTKIKCFAYSLPYKLKNYK